MADGRPSIHSWGICRRWWSCGGGSWWWRWRAEISLLCEKILGIVAVYARVTLGGGGAAVVAAGGGDGARKLVFCVKRSSELWLSMRVSLSEVVELRW